MIAELKRKLIETLNLIDVQAEDIDENDPLVGGKLDIDSIDILELVIMIEKDYGVKIDNRDIGVKVFSNLKTLADYIQHNTRENPA